VLLDVSQSYRAAILQTAKAFGAPITSADINKVLCPFAARSLMSRVPVRPRLHYRLLTLCPLRPVVSVYVCMYVCMYVCIIYIYVYIYMPIGPVLSPVAGCISFCGSPWRLVLPI